MNTQNKHFLELVLGVGAYIVKSVLIVATSPFSA